MTPHFLGFRAVLSQVRFEKFFNSFRTQKTALLSACKRKIHYVKKGDKNRSLGMLLMFSLVLRLQKELTRHAYYFDHHSGFFVVLSQSLNNKLNIYKYLTSGMLTYDILIILSSQ